MTSTMINRIRSRMTDLNLSEREISLKAGLSHSFVTSITSGRVKSPRMDNFRSLADALHCHPDYLLGKIDTLYPPSHTGAKQSVIDIPIVGFVQAGVFEVVDEFEGESPETIPLPRSRRYPDATHLAYRVRGDSMNLANIVDGDIICVVKAEDTGLRMWSGAIVVVEQTRDGGALRERTVKQLEVQEDRFVLNPRSSNRNHKPIVIKRSSDDDFTEVRIIGELSGMYREF